MAKKKEVEETQEQETKKKGRKSDMPMQNNVRRPKPDTSTGRVWQIADQISAEAGRPAYRSEVLEIFVGEGGNPSTGATQYGRWCKFHGLVGDNSPGRAPTEKAEEEAEVDDAPEVE